MVAESADKGAALEKAVHAIEQAIFGMSPNLADKALKIERRKIQTINGVKREYDLYITVDMAPGYSAVYIFECKNWEAGVGPSEITDFAAKIDMVKAAGGFFVAKSFTESAEAQAKLHPRITLLQAIEHPIDLAAFPAMRNVRAKKIAEIGYRLHESDTGALIVAGENPTVSLAGVITPFNVIYKELMEITVREDFQRALDEDLPEGDHERVVEGVFTPTSGELVVDGHVIGKAEIRVAYTAEVQQAPVESHFEVVSRARVISYKPIMIGNKKFHFHTILQNISLREQIEAAASQSPG